MHSGAWGPAGVTLSDCGDTAFGSDALDMHPETLVPFWKGVPEGAIS